MDKEKALVLLKQSKVEWNRWANHQLATRETLKAAGRWSEGSDPIAWNDVTRAWHDAVTLEFSKHVFQHSVDLRMFIFPGDAWFDEVEFKGTAWFDGAQFHGSTSFSGTLFQNSVRFVNTRFGGTTEFDNVQFQNSAKFDRARFQGQLGFTNTVSKDRQSFIGTRFDKPAYFGHSKFGRNVQFRDAHFSHNLTFVGAQFDGNANFSNVHFLQSADFGSATLGGGISFYGAEFFGNAGFVSTSFDGFAWFHQTKFRKLVSFVDSRFKEGADFNASSFLGAAGFRHAAFEGPATFEETNFKNSVDFYAIQSRSAFSLAGTRFARVPDFIQADFRTSPRLDNIIVEPWRIPKIFTQIKSEEKGVGRQVHPADNTSNLERAARWRALKGLAINAHDHPREQRFFKGEILARRHFEDEFWHGTFVFGYLYQLVSDFGRSTVRPVLLLVFCLFGFMNFYLQHSTGNDQREVSVAWWVLQWADRVAGHRERPSIIPCEVGDGDQIATGLLLSFHKTLPIPSIGGAEKINQHYACLYGIHQYEGYKEGQLGRSFTPVIPPIVSWVGALQSTISLILLFLLFLAIRNHFRIR